MGYGDALMAAGQAQRLYATTPSAGPITIVDRHGRGRWNPIWQGNPVIRPPDRHQAPFRAPYLITGKGAVPYIHHPYSAQTGWRFTDWRACAHRGRLYLTEDELAGGRDLRRAIGSYVILEPTALRKSINRRAPIGLWTGLRLLLRDLPFACVQLAYEGADVIPHLTQVPHASFRAACGILASAAGLICTEGGLAHAAAALQIPAIVLWGGNISAPALSYPEHVNLVDDDPRTPCGSLIPCDHCAAAWQRLSLAPIARAACRWQR